MLRQTITRPVVTANRALLQRSFSAVAPRMGEGDTGAPRSGAGGSSGYVALLSPAFPTESVPYDGGGGTVSIEATYTPLPALPQLK